MPHRHTKNADARSVSPHVGFGDNFGDLGFGVPARTENLARGRGGRAGIHYRLGNIPGSLESATNKHTLPVGGYRCKGIGLTKISGRQFNSQILGQLDGFRRCLHPDGKYDHIEDFSGYVTVFSDIANLEIIAPMHRIDGVHPAA